MAITEARKDELLNDASLLRNEATRIIEGAVVIFDVNDPPSFVDNPFGNVGDDQ